MDKITINDIPAEEIEIEETIPEPIEIKEVYVREIKTVTIEKTIKEKGLKGDKGDKGEKGIGKDGKTPTKTELKALIKEVFPEDKLIQKVINKMPKEELDSMEIGEDQRGQWISKNGQKMYIKSVSNIGAGMSTGVYDFIALRDTPSSYTGQAGKVVKVKSDETGLEFGTGGGGGGSVFVNGVEVTDPNFENSTDIQLNNAAPDIQLFIVDGSVTDDKVSTGIDALKIGSGDVDNTEYSYLDGVTDFIQSQLDGKEPTRGADDNYVTDAQLTVIQNTSGTNTGDQVGDGITITGSGTVGDPFVAVSGGSGDVTGPASAVDNNFASFDLTTGKIIQDSGFSSSSFATASQGALADSALQSSDIGVTIQAHSSVLDNTTASFTTTDETKLDGIEAGADVTDSTNVSAAGAFMKSTDDTDDITEGVTNLFMDTTEQGKLANITVTQPVDLDQMEIDIAALANGMVYKGNWDASTGTFPGSGSAQTGWFYTVSVGGTVDGVEFHVDDSNIAIVDNASTTTYAGNWSKKDSTDAVTSVFGRVGNVVATNGDYTASNITNVPAGGVASVTVQAAIDELDTEKAPKDDPTFTTKITTPVVRASTSGGVIIEANNGTDVGLLGAGNTANVTWYGAHNFDTQTQDTIAGFTGAGKTLGSLPTATYPSLTELSYGKGVTSAIQTQLNGKQATGNYITALTGDVTASGPGSSSATLATVNSNVGSFGSATQSLTATVNGKGLITAISAQTVTPAIGSVTGLGTGVSTALSTNVGTAGAPVVNGGALGTPSSGNLANCTFPTLNQNTTGSAATLTTPRAIYGNNFDGSAALNQVIASTYGGTGNGWLKFVGPTTSEKTFTIPDANLTITSASATVLDDTTVGDMVNTLGGATSTGTGGLVRATSPTLVTPALGTPSALVLTNATGLPTAGLVDDAVTLAKMASGTAGNLITYDASGNPAYVSTGTAGQVLTSNGAGAAPTMQDFTGLPKINISSIFEASGRFTQSVSGGTATFNTNGLNLATTTTSSRFASSRLELFDAYLFLGNPTFTCQLKADTVTASGSGDAFFGINWMTIAGGAGGITFTERHIGFKFTKVSSTTVNLAGTQADGTTEATTGTLTTVANGDVFDLIFVANSSSSVTYYYRKNGGALSSGTTVSTNFPTRSLSTQDSLAFMTTNKGTATAFNYNVYSMSYSR